jgi:hypothetical protein
MSVTYVFKRCGITKVKNKRQKIHQVVLQDPKQLKKILGTAAIYTGFDLRQRQNIFPCSLCVQTDSGTHLSSFTMYRGLFHGGKERPGRDAGHSAIIFTLFLHYFYYYFFQINFNLF